MPVAQQIPRRVGVRALTRFVVNKTGCHVSNYSPGSHGYAQIGYAVESEREPGSVQIYPEAALEFVNKPVGFGE